MNLCNEGHDEVCFDGRVCPCYYKMEEIKTLESEIADLKKERDDLKDQLESEQ